MARSTLWQHFASRRAPGGSGGQRRCRRWPTSSSRRGRRGGPRACSARCGGSPRGCGGSGTRCPGPPARSSYGEPHSCSSTPSPRSSARCFAACRSGRRLRRLRLGSAPPASWRAAAAGVTRCTMLPSQLADALASSRRARARRPALRVATVSGEPLWDPEALAATLRGVAPAARLLSLYGSSECAGDVACYEPRAGRRRRLPPARARRWVAPSAAPRSSSRGPTTAAAGAGAHRAAPASSSSSVRRRRRLLRPAGRGPGGELPDRRRAARLLAGTSGNGDHGAVRMGDRCAVGADGVLRWLGRVDLVRKLRGARVGLERLECVAAGACGGGVACVVVEPTAPRSCSSALTRTRRRPVLSPSRRRLESRPRSRARASRAPTSASWRHRCRARPRASSTARGSRRPSPPFRRSPVRVPAAAAGGRTGYRRRLLPAAGVAAQLADVYRELLPEVLAGRRRRIGSTASSSRCPAGRRCGSSRRSRASARWGVRLAPAALGRAARRGGAQRRGGCRARRRSHRRASGDGGGPRRVFGSVAEARAYWDATGAATDVARSARCRWAVVPLTASLVRQTAALAATCLADREPLTVAARLSTRARDALRRFIRRFAFRLLAAPENFSWVAVDVAAPGRRASSASRSTNCCGRARRHLRRRGRRPARRRRLATPAAPGGRLAALFGVAGLDDAERIYAALYVHWSTTDARRRHQLALSGVTDCAGGINAAAVFAALDGAAPRGARRRLASACLPSRPAKCRSSSRRRRPAADRAARRAAPLSRRPRRGFFAAGGGGGSASSTTP